MTTTSTPDPKKTMTPNRSFNEIIADGDATTIISKNKNTLIALGVFIVVGILGYGLYLNYSEKTSVVKNSKIYDFESTVVKTYTDKSDPKQAVEKLQNLKKDIGNYIGLVPVAIKLSDLLISNAHLSEALEVLKIGALASKNEYSDYFILSRLAVVYEDQGNTKDAIETLEKLNSSSVKIFEGKNYLDLGRLYLKTDNKEKAKASFTYVVEKAKDESEFVKVAKLYLLKL